MDSAMISVSGGSESGYCINMRMARDSAPAEIFFERGDEIADISNFKFFLSVGDRDIDGCLKMLDAETLVFDPSLMPEDMRPDLYDVKIGVRTGDYDFAISAQLDWMG